jgi:hypothetical protein
MDTPDRNNIDKSVGTLVAHPLYPFAHQSVGEHALVKTVTPGGTAAATVALVLRGFPVSGSWFEGKAVIAWGSLHPTFNLPEWYVTAEGGLYGLAANYLSYANAAWEDANDWFGPLKNADAFFKLSITISGAGLVTATILPENGVGTTCSLTPASGVTNGNVYFGSLNTTVKAAIDVIGDTLVDADGLKLIAVDPTGVLATPGPYNVTLTDNTIVPGETAVGTVAGVGGSGTKEYTLITNYGDAALFTLTGTTLAFKAPAVKGIYAVKINCRDTATGSNFTKEFSIGVGAIPTDITLSAATIVHDSPIGTVVGTLVTTDADSGPTEATYTLVAGTGGTDNAKYRIVGDALQAAIANLAAGAQTVRVRSTDEAGQYFEKAFAITVTA